jgi:ABC-2 type transport system permease protein
MPDLTTPRATARATARASALADPLTMAARCLRISRRQIDALLTSLLLPVMLLVVFVYLFGGAIRTGNRQYITYVVPGVLLLCTAVGSTSTAVSVSRDMTGGIIDRFRSMDIGGASVLAGHVAASVARNVVSTVLVLGVALAIGFRPHAGLAAWLAVAGLLVLFVSAVSWLCAAWGLLAGSPEAAGGCMFLLMFATYASSAFVPIRTMPGWMHGFAAHQPATPVIETLRGLLLGTPVGAAPRQALAWCGGILVAAVLACAALFRRRAG